MTAATDGLVIVNAFPLLAEPQGDEGNARVLTWRAGLRGLATTVLTHHGSGALPGADLYLIGGLEGEEHSELAERLRDGGLKRAVEGGSVVLAVNAGYQVLGRRFQAADGAWHDGLGLLDAISTWEQLAEGPAITRASAELGLPAMSGYECHHGRTELGAGARPLAALERGVGNGGPAATDGAVATTVVGTYLHGPVLARNVELADLLLGWAVGGPLEPAEAGYAGELRRQRITEDRRDPTGWGGRVYGRTRLLGLRRRTGS
jgi:CobQ-like glutamine amidotransferase family enzyme